MITNSLNAIRKLLKDTFPVVNRIYLNTMPDEFERPSFFVQQVTTTEQHLNKKMYSVRFTWQIVYFAPIDTVGNPNTFNQFDVSSKLKAAIMENMVLVSPDDGTVFHVLDCTGGPRDAEVYITVRLETEYSRLEPEFEKMQELDIDV